MDVTPEEYSKLHTIKEKHSLTLLTKDNVVGVGIGSKVVDNVNTFKLCITVYVCPKLPLSNISEVDIIPREIEGIETDVLDFGTSKRGTRSAISPSGSRGKRHRPAPGGVSVGHYAFKGAGTLGGWVKDRTTGEILLLSCWHILTNMGKGRKGDPIIQPAWLDGGRHPQDTIATLERWVDVNFVTKKPNFSEARKKLKKILSKGQSPPFNKVDCALAKPISKDVISDEILGIGSPSYDAQIDSFQLGTKVVKSGRTIGVTSGTIQTLDVDLLVWYPVGIAIFKNQCAISNLKNA